MKNKYYDINKIDKDGMYFIRISKGVKRMDAVKNTNDFVKDLCECCKDEERKNWAQIGSSGDGAKIGSSGNWAQIGSSGNGTDVKSDGNNCVIVCAGNDCRVKATIGSWIVLTEWKMELGKKVPINVVARKVDGEEIRENTWYKLENGVFVAEEEEDNE